MFEGQNFRQGQFYVIVWPLMTSYIDQSECFTFKDDTHSFHLSGHSSNSIKNWPLKVKLYLPYPKLCASFWKPTSTLLPLVWTSTLIFMMPHMSVYSNQVRNRVALSGMQMTPRWYIVDPSFCFTIFTVKNESNLLWTRFLSHEGVL